MSAAMVTAGVIATAIALLQMALVVAAKHQVQSAADLAALAGSSTAVKGGDACALARSVAGRHAVRLEGCEVDLAVVTVHAATRPRRTWGITWTARAVARAAPSYYVSPDGSPPAHPIRD